MEALLKFHILILVIFSSLFYVFNKLIFFICLFVSVDMAASDGAASDRFGRTELPCLRRIITQLSKGEKRDDVEFEDSTLSSFLCASIGGNARTLLICNVTPTVLVETASTLDFGSRAKLITNQPRINEISSDEVCH